MNLCSAVRASSGGFSFVKAFSKDLFGSKKPASLKDVELNPQARSAPFLFLES